MTDIDEAQDLDDAVSWGEAASALSRDLMMDAEWTHIWPNGLMWWPGPLPQRIQMVGSIDHGSPDQTILLEATTDVFYIPDDEELGADIATVLNEDFYFGSFSWSDDVLRVTSSLAWNRNCREMLMAFRQACLQQATRANQIALAYLDIPSLLDPEPRPPFSDSGFIVCEQPHPVQGMRQDIDEMLTIYAGEHAAVPTPTDLPERIASAREESRQILHEIGFASEHGPGNAEWLTSDDADILVQPLDDPGRSAKYGVGLILRACVRPDPNQAPDTVLNAGNNIAISNGEFGVSHLAPVVWDEHFGLHLRQVLDAAALASAPNLTAMITNALLQLAASAATLRPGRQPSGDSDIDEQIE